MILMRVLSWNLSWQTSITHRLESCAGVWSWDALTSSLRCQCGPITFVCCVKGTRKLSSMCLYTLRCIKIYPSVDMGAFMIKNDWICMYDDVKETIPPDSSVPHGKEVDLCVFVDSDHAGDASNSQGVQGLDLQSTGTWCHLCGSPRTSQLCNHVLCF
jgi:hypothetical protein